MEELRSSPPKIEFSHDVADGHIADHKRGQWLESEPSSSPRSKTIVPARSVVTMNDDLFDGTDDWDIPERVSSQKFFIQIDHDQVTSMIDAFRALDKVMREEGIGHLISRKRVHSYAGRTVSTGQIGILTYKGRPILVTKAGRYWNWSPTHNWYSRDNFDLTKVTEVYGLTFAQVGQSEAMVVLDPSNQVFIVRNGGFAAYGSQGTYKVVEVVDTLNLGEEYAICETADEGGGRGRVLGYKKEVKIVHKVGGRNHSTTIATFFNVPAQNTVVVQHGSHLRSLDAGQHVITNPRTTYRGFFSLGERQTSFQTQPAYTLEGVPVILHVNLRYRVIDAIELTKSYETAFQALRNPAQSAVNGVVSRLSYQQFMRAKKVQGDIPDYENMSWLEAFKSECMEDLASHAIEYGVKVLSFDVLDRQLQGKLGQDLEAAAEQVLKNQMQSTQVALQNRINTETEQGRLQVAAVRAEQTQTEANANYAKKTKEADSSYYTNMKEADARAETIRRIAQANADANSIESAQKANAIKQIAEAEARSIELEGKGYASVLSEHAQRMHLEDVETRKFASLSKNATLFIGGGDSSTATRNIPDGYTWAKGLSLGKATAQ